MKKKNSQTKYIVNIISILIAAAILAASEQFNPLKWIPHIPVRRESDKFIDWLTDNFGSVFDAISAIIDSVLNPLQTVLTSERFLLILPGFGTVEPFVPQFFIIVAITLLGYYLSSWKLGGFILFSLLLISGMGLFEPTMVTLSLILTATFFALLFGIPLGIIKAHSSWVRFFVDPILDFMQTMPLFVYLIPVVLFFGIGDIPGVVATFIFSTPPAVRLTALGIEQIPKEMIEAGMSFGATPWQLLYKIEIPLAMPSIMAGVNQTIMLSLAMVVVAAMVGASGLGLEVYSGITRLQVGQGIAGGIGIVLLAMILDQITKAVYQRSKL